MTVKSIQFLRDAVVYVTAAVLVIAIPAFSFWGVWIFVTGQFGSSTIGPVANLIGQFLTSLLGAGAGAYFAFQFDREQKQKEEYRRYAEVASLAVIRLSLMHSAYSNYRAQFIAPAMRDHPETLWHHLPPGSMHVGPHFDIDLGALKFLFRGTDLSILAELGLEDMRFRACNELIDRRSRMHHEEMQPALEQVTFEGGPTIDSISAAIGPRMTQSMKGYTNAIIEQVDKGLESTAKAASRLKAAAKPLVNGEVVVGFEPNPAYVAPANPA